MIFVKIRLVVPLASIIVFALTSCGKSKSNGRTFIEYQVGGATPIVLQETECDGKRVPYTTINWDYKTYEYQKNQIIELENSADSFDLSQAIASVTYGGKSSYQFENNNFYQKKDGIKGKVLTLCNAVSNYPRFSVEEAALATISVIKDAYNFMKLNSDYLVSALNLKINHRIAVSQQVRQKNRIIQVDADYTDNAFFQGEDKSIIILPQSLEENEGGELFSSIPLWNIPMVIAHEYGHHVLTEMFSKLNFPQMLRHQYGVNCFHRVKKEKLLGLKGNLKKITKEEENEKFVSFYHEAFSDLFSYYLLGDRSTLSGIRCLQKTRDIRSAFFQNYSFKKADRLQLEQYFSGMVNPLDRESYDCSVVDYSDKYTHAAIFAYTVDKLFDSTLSSDGLVINSNNQKIKKLLSLTEKIFSPQNRKFSLENVMAEAMTLSGWNSKNCKLLSMHYPDMNLETCRVILNNDL